MSEREFDDPALKVPPKVLTFARVREAREALQAKAEKWARDYDRIIDLAIQKGEFEVASEAIQWAFEHMPKDEGLSVIDQSVDKVQVNTQAAAPPIQFGIVLGGLAATPTQATLPPASVEAEIVEVKPVDVSEKTLSSERSPVEQPGGGKVQRRRTRTVRPPSETAGVPRPDGT